MIRALLFDLDDTLINTHESHGAAMDAAVRAAAAVHETVAAPTLAAAFHEASTVVGRRLERGAQPVTSQREYRAAVFAEALRELDLPPDLAPDLSAVYLEARRGTHRLFEDVEAALTRLSRRYHLVLVTNGLSDLQREKVESVQLGRWFSDVVVSGELQVWKPDPGIFHFALSLAEAEVSEAVMIGDSLHHDIRGAEGVGMKSIWMRRYEHLAPQPEISPTAVLSDLHELGFCIDTWNND